MKFNAVSPDGGRVSLEVNGDLVTLRGYVDQVESRAFLSEHLQRIHAGAEDEGLHEVKVDIRGVLFLNSSAVKELISWLLKRNRMPPEKKYAIVFIYDSSILWQRVTLPTLGQLDPGFVSLSDHGKHWPKGP